MEIENEQVEEMFLVLMEKMEKTISVLRTDYSAVRAGRANPHILDKITVDYYGAITPLNQIGNISSVDARCLVISPWDTSILKDIEKAIQQSNIGLTPTNDGKIIRLVFPELTEERRKDIAKTIKKMAEESKIALRNIRRETLDGLKKLNKDKKITDDEIALYEKDVEKEMTKTMEQLDKVYSEKEKEILSV